jgi:hypothetical protein
METVDKKQSGEICSGNMKYFYKNSGNYCSAFYNTSTGMAAARIGGNFFKGIPGYQTEVLLAGIARIYTNYQLSCGLHWQHNWYFM